MSYFSSWPKIKVAKMRGVGELIMKTVRVSLKVDKVLLPLLIPTMAVVYLTTNRSFTGDRERKNPYTEAIIKKK